jgi:hypothetical protein
MLEGIGFDMIGGCKELISPKLDILMAYAISICTSQIFSNQEFKIT